MTTTVLRWPIVTRWRLTPRGPRWRYVTWNGRTRAITCVRAPMTWDQMGACLSSCRCNVRPSSDLSVPCNQNPQICYFVSEGTHRTNFITDGWFPINPWHLQGGCDIQCSRMILQLGLIDMHLLLVMGIITARLSVRPSYFMMGILYLKRRSLY